MGYEQDLVELRLENEKLRKSRDEFEAWGRGAEGALVRLRDDSYQIRNHMACPSPLVKMVTERLQTMIYDCMKTLSTTPASSLDRVIREVRLKAIKWARSEVVSSTMIVTTLDAEIEKLEGEKAKPTGFCSKHQNGEIGCTICYPKRLREGR